MDLSKLFYKHKRISKEDEYSELAMHSHFNIIKTAKTWTNALSEEEKDFLLTYLINTILDDVCAESVFRPITAEHSSPYRLTLPWEYFDENGNKIFVRYDEPIEINLATTRILTCPWSNERTPKALLDIKNKKFQFMEGNHSAVFYEDIGLCQVCNGYHSINAGRYLKKGTIKADVCHLEQFYPHCVTDGYNWINTHTKKPFATASDFRLAAVYSLARMRAGFNK